jgi:DNA-binding LytR/AlgR family response regulator
VTTSLLSLQSREPDVPLDEPTCGFPSRPPAEPRSLPALLVNLPPGEVPIVARKGRALVFLRSREVWAFEARDGLVYLHAHAGCFDIDRSLSEVMAVLGAPFARVHRSWVVGLAKVREFRSTNAGHTLFVSDSVAELARGVEVPIARERVRAVRRSLLEGSFGLRVQSTASGDDLDVGSA